MRREAKKEGKTYDEYVKEFSDKGLSRAEDTGDLEKGGVVQRSASDDGDETDTSQRRREIVMPEKCMMKVNGRAP